jgi:hypothetical protein
VNLIATDQMTAWVRVEQELLWDDLRDAIDGAINRVWSIRAANIARRIVEAARLVGPTPHDGVPWPILAGGVYETILRAGELSPELPDEAEWRRLDELMQRYGTRATLRPQFAATVAEINTDRERNWINRGDE